MALGSYPGNLLMDFFESFPHSLKDTKGQDVEKLEASRITGGTLKPTECCRHLGKQFGGFTRKFNKVPYNIAIQRLPS